MSDKTEQAQVKNDQVTTRRDEHTSTKEKVPPTITQSFTQSLIRSTSKSSPSGLSPSSSQSPFQNLPTTLILGIAPYLKNPRVHDHLALSSSCAIHLALYSTVPDLSLLVSQALVGSIPWPDLPEGSLSCATKPREITRRGYGMELMVLQIKLIGPVWSSSMWWGGARFILLFSCMKMKSWRRG